MIVETAELLILTVIAKVGRSFSKLAHQKIHKLDTPEKLDKLYKFEEAQENLEQLIQERKKTLKDLL